MSEPETLGLFPSPFYRVNLADEIDLDEIQQLLNFANNEKNYILNINKNYISIENNVLNVVLPSSSKLQKILNYHVDNFIKNVLGQENANLKIHLSWLNKNPKGTSNHKHYHSNSIVSGVFYLTVNDDSGKFCVHRDISQRMTIQDKITKHNHFTYDYYHFIPKQYDLYIFPSTTYHSVEENKSDETRISFAFNTFYEGKIGLSPTAGLEVGSIETGYNHS